MKKIIIIILCLTAFRGFAQNSDTVYHYTDLSLKPVKKENAKITFKLFRSNASSWTFLKYNEKNILLLKETYADSLLSVKHGQYVQYKAGKTSLKGMFINNMKHGNFISYDLEGIVEDVTLYHLDTVKTSVVYYPSGEKREEKIFQHKNQLAERQLYYENGKLAIKERFSTDNKLAEEIYLDREGKPVALSDIESVPTFAGGIQRFYEYVGKTLRYPSIAFKSSIQGTVLISFDVLENGEVTNVKVAKSVDPELDRAAIKVVISSPKWIPGKRLGKNVKSSHSVPIKFSLSEA